MKTLYVCKGCEQPCLLTVLLGPVLFPPPTICPYDAPITKVLWVEKKQKKSRKK